VGEIRKGVIKNLFKKKVKRLNKARENLIGSTKTVSLHVDLSIDNTKEL